MLSCQNACLLKNLKDAACFYWV